jgi:hypothetical protein
MDTLEMRKEKEKGFSIVYIKCLQLRWSIDYFCTVYRKNNLGTVDLPYSVKNNLHWR